MKRLIKTSSCIIAITLFAGCSYLCTKQEKPDVACSRKLQTKELNKLKQFALGCFLYAEDNGGRLPATITQLKPYLGNEFDFRHIKLIEKNKKLVEFKCPSRTILAISTKVLANNTRAVAFVDGHCKIVPAKIKK